MVERSFHMPKLGRKGGADRSRRRQSQIRDAYDVVIIGAGHNGLVCGAYLAKAGQNVLILDANEAPGGVCQTGEVDTDVTGPRGAHLITHLSPQVIKDLGLHRKGLQFVARSLPTVCLDPEGPAIVLHKNAWKTAQSLEAISKPDSEVIRDFLGNLAFGGEQIKSWLEQPLPMPGSDGFTNIFVPDNRKGMRSARQRKQQEHAMKDIVRTAFSSVGDLLDECLETPSLKGALALDALLGHFAGPQDPGTGWHLLTRWAGETSGVHGGVAYPKGGMGKLTDALVKAFTQSGGMLRTNALVRKIIIADGKTEGVELTNGDFVSSRIVVSSADPQSTFLDMVGVAELDAESAQRISQIKMNGITSKLNLVLDGLPKQREQELSYDARFLCAPSLGSLDAGYSAAKRGELPKDPLMEFILPSALDAGAGRDGEHILSVIIQYTPYKNKAGWDKERETLIQSAADHLGVYFPELSERIIGGELLTPPDIEREFNLRGGHWHHGEMELRNAVMARPAEGMEHYRSQIVGLYLCGAGAHPGGRITGLPGMNAAKVILSDGVAASGHTNDNIREGSTPPLNTEEAAE